jgi:hypothetical protein
MSVVRALGVLARDGPDAGWCVVERGRFKIRHSAPFNVKALRARPVSRDELFWSWSYDSVWRRLEILENGKRVFGVLWTQSTFMVRSFRMYVDPPWYKRFRRWTKKLLQHD